jgi:hypothetical protein
LEVVAGVSGGDSRLKRIDATRNRRLGKQDIAVILRNNHARDTEEISGAFARLAAPTRVTPSQVMVESATS